jgi:hypothetical protein
MEAFKSAIGFLTGIAIFIAIINFYFKANKIWKRKHEKEVAESQSIVALISEAMLYILWSVSFIMNSDWNALADNAVGLVESAFFIVIGSGLFVLEKKKSKKSFYQMIKDSLTAEKKEASYLLKSMSGKNTAEKILNILKQLAWIDDDFDKKEIELVKHFASEWGVKVNENDFLVNPHTGNSEYIERFENIKKALFDYLMENTPNKEHTMQISKILHDLINADGVISKEEDLIMGELDGIILEYLGEPVPVYLVITVPQEASQLHTIENILKSVHPLIDVKSKEKKIDGGFGFIMHECRSQAFAELMAEQERSNHKLMTIIKKEIKESKVKENDEDSD